ncbi:hypothetical protein E2C01_014607 [Portunus trituberculatus]|uniref:Uncharacterized protein n=1 Tax=Portunus trituberculatus TaxID=210409 RepID=A0A5B7DJP5_PORTR|nr:hypothetical protein [Portunus trituberculatus]
MRELKKIQSAPSGSASKVSGKWEFYDCLVFLTAGCEELMSVSESSWQRPTHQQLEGAEELREAGESGPNDCHPVLNLKSNTTELIPELDIVKEEVEEEVTLVKKKVRLSEGMSSEQVMPVRGGTLSCIRQEDEWNTYGRTVANSLRKLPCHVQPYAQKLISDVIFYAQIGQLDLNSKIVTK